jgi:hypothetical protein
MKKVGIIFGIIVILIVLVIFVGFFYKNKENNANMMQKELKIGEKTLNVAVADTDAVRIQGLSGKKELGANEGMLFAFEKLGNYGIWMKDMNFAIDIAWINEERRIVYIENDIKPETYPKNFGLNVTSLYVLEMPAGFLVKNNVKIGDLVAF